MKSKNRVPSYYKEGTEDWKAEYDMLLDDGVTCKQCRNCKKCTTIFGQKETDTSCQFYPSRFKERENNAR